MRMLEPRRTLRSRALILCTLALVNGCNHLGDCQHAAEHVHPSEPEAMDVKFVAQAQYLGQRASISRLPSLQGHAQSVPVLELLPPIPGQRLSDPPLRVPRCDGPSPSTDVEPTPPEPRRVFAVEEFDDDAELAASTSPDDVLAFFPAEAELSEQLKSRVQGTFTLARHGALHAARGRFEQLLHELAQGKDASHMTGRHVRSLAAGLRALDEADDFVAAGSDREISSRSLAAGHQTPMLHETEHKWTLPHEAIAMYHLYAQQKLAAAVQGEQAGSMMLFGLGKIYAQLAERDELQQAKRKSLTMYRSALGAHGGNHLAANEAGVLLARGGRYALAGQLLEQAARNGGPSTTHRNLAYVHSKLGNIQLAQQHESVAQTLAQRERSSGQMSAERGIAWVSPEQFARRTQAPPAALASRPAPTAASVQQVAPPPIPKQATEPTQPPQPRKLWW